ncbi:MAG: NAD(P)H-dependent oxidoreductase subunit E [Bradymonadales bacterium]|nr:NAD(P)H-dependent oxidoreductase subunit E [Bradymonadales bacterium]
MCRDPLDPLPPFAFRDETEKELQQLLSRAPTPAAAILPALHLVQKEHGYISTAAMDYLAGRLAIPPSKVLADATFYEMYRCYPVGHYLIQVCTGPSCALLGADRILDHLADRLGIKPGQTTPDRLFTLGRTECLAACGSAPVITCNGQLYEEMSVEKVDQLLADWSAAAARQPGESEWTGS